MSGAVGVGQPVRYAGALWTVSRVSPDPVNIGSFVDLSKDDAPDETARVHSAFLADDTSGGWTWQENRAQPGPRNSGDPRYPLLGEYLERHQKFNAMVDGLARQLFAGSTWALTCGWESLEESRRSQLRTLVRGVILNQPLGPLPQGVTATQARNRVMALLPQDLKDWLVANPQ